MGPGRIIPVRTREELEELRGLFVEYAESLRYHLCFDSFQAELAQLPGVYALPDGRLLMAKIGGEPAGCVALRRIAARLGELKRLYVRPAWRRHGLGRELVTRVLAEARQAGYSAVRLDTLPSMGEAQALYRSLGFRFLDAAGSGGRPDHPVLMELSL